jgi:hypothetical protein
MLFSQEKLEIFFFHPVALGLLIAACLALVTAT